MSLTTRQYLELSSSQAMDNDLEMPEGLVLCRVTWIVFTTFLNFAIHHISWNLFADGLSVSLAPGLPDFSASLPVAARCWPMNRPWACWRTARARRPPSGYKCSSLSAALTPTSSSTATSRSATTPRECVSLWVSPCSRHSSNRSQRPVETSSLLYVRLMSLI